MSILKTRTDKLSVREFLQSAGTRNSDRTKTDQPKNERKNVGTDFFDISNEVIVKVRGSVRAKKERGTNFYDHLKESDRKFCGNTRSKKPKSPLQQTSKQGRYGLFRTPTADCGLVNSYV